MVPSSYHRGAQRTSWLHHILVPALVVGSLLQCTAAEQYPVSKGNWQARFMHYTKRDIPTKRGPPADQDGKIPLLITNHCDTTIWPGLASQTGTGPGTGGFELAAGESKRLWVGSNWQGRVWGRTNCTVNKDSCSCKTGDCFGKLNCEFSVSPASGTCHRYWH